MLAAPAPWMGRAALKQCENRLRPARSPVNLTTRCHPRAMGSLPGADRTIVTIVHLPLAGGSDIVLVLSVVFVFLESSAWLRTIPGAVSLSSHPRLRFTKRG